MKAESCIGIIGAMDVEIEKLTSELSGSRNYPVGGLAFIKGTLYELPIVIVKCGVGKVNAAICTQILIDRFRPDFLINLGIAGGLSPALSIGDVVIAAGLLQHDFDVSSFGHARGYMCTNQNDSQPTIYPADMKLVQLLGKAAEEAIGLRRISFGLIATGDQFVSNKGKKSELYHEFSAVAADMEGGAIAQTAYLNRVPFAVVRTISDLADGTAAQSYSVFEKEAADISATIITNSIKKLGGTSLCPATIALNQH